jgi:hypothetical protein
VTTPRPFRFGFTGGVSSKREKLLDSARRVESLGYSTYGLADHFVRPFAPLVAGQAVADATTTLRITQTVLAQDFREPAVLAKELATLDVLSDGRLQVGLGAGWLRQEYEDAGMRFDSASERIARLEETAIILKGLFGDEPFSYTGEHYSIRELTGVPTPVQRPRPPIMIGGGGRKVLSVAARQADIVQLMPTNRGGRTSLDPSQFSPPPDAGSMTSSSAPSCSTAPSPIGRRSTSATSPIASPWSPSAWVGPAWTWGSTTSATRRSSLSAPWTTSARSWSRHGSATASATSRRRSTAVRRRWPR